MAFPAVSYTSAVTTALWCTPAAEITSDAGTDRKRIPTGVGAGAVGAPMTTTHPVPKTAVPGTATLIEPNPPCLGVTSPAADRTKGGSTGSATPDDQASVVPTGKLGGATAVSCTDGPPVVSTWNAVGPIAMSGRIVHQTGSVTVICIVPDTVTPEGSVATTDTAAV